MPSSVGSFWSRRSSPNPGYRFDPFLILNAHAEHYTSTSIVELPESNKIFCPLCLEMRSSEDIESMELEAYNRYIGDLLDILERYGETLKLRKIILPILEIFLPKRPFVLDRDDKFHRFLRIIYKLMRSDLYNQNEFMTLAKIMSGISIESLQPVPLRSAWEAWKYMLDQGGSISFGILIDQNSQFVPENLTRFYIGQAIIVKTYLNLINQVVTDKISDLVFTPNIYKQEAVTCKYYVDSQIRCLKFTEDQLIPNCECYLHRETEQSLLELQVISELFGALRECFINAVRRDDQQFLERFNQRDLIATIHRIFTRNPSVDYRSNLFAFLKTYVQHYIEKEYGVHQDLTDIFIRVGGVETIANKIEQLDGNEEHSTVYIFYLLLNWVAIKTRSRYFAIHRVSKVLTRNSKDLLSIRQKIKGSHILMRIYAFVTANSIKNIKINCSVTSFLKNNWIEMHTGMTLSIFRYIYCHESIVFEWAYKDEDFIRLVNCDSIGYLIDQGFKRNNLVSITTKLVQSTRLRDIFCRYIKRNATTLFKKLVSLGGYGMDRRIVNEFNHWLTVLFQETLLRYMNNATHREVLCERLTNLLMGINILLEDSVRSKFNPTIDNQFVIDFTKFLESIYLKTSRSCNEQSVLIAAHEFMALLINCNHSCVMKLLQYIDFTLIGYMYHTLENYNLNHDPLADAIAQVLVSYNNLDYPLEHRIDRSIYSMSSSAYEWMMSSNPDLHALALVLMDKFYPSLISTHSGHQNVSDAARACLVTGFMHMLCVNTDIIAKDLNKTTIVRILKFDDFKFHPLYSHLLNRVPKLNEALNPYDDSEYLPSDLSFESADTNLFGDEQNCVTRILEQLHEDEGYRSASTVMLPSNLYLNRTINEQSSDFAGTMEWERKATQSSD